MISQNTRTLYRLTIILLVFPIVVVYVFPLAESAARLYSGDRTYWSAYWQMAAAVEWLTLILVLVSYQRWAAALREVGFPLPPPRQQFIFGAAFLSAAAVLAIAGTTETQLFLDRIPGRIQMFIPPPFLQDRLLWVAVAATAAICEEIMWRGIAITELRRLTNSTAAAVLISSFSFTFFHGGFEQGVAVFAYRFALSLVFAGIYLKRRKLGLVILIHFLADISSLAAIDIT